MIGGVRCPHVAESSYQWLERANPLLYFLRRTDQCINQRVIDVEFTFVFRDISLPMRLIENPPFSRLERQRVFETLKHEVAVLRAKSVPSKRGQCQRMCRVVGEVEIAVTAE